MKQAVNIIWCKKNLRLHDNEILSHIDENIATLAVFFFEPQIMNGPDYSDFHLKFILESLIELQVSFYKLGIPLLLLPYNAENGFIRLEEDFIILSIFSHEETGNWASFQRDKNMLQYCKKNNILFQEYPTNGVVRRLKSRNNWSQIWKVRMSQDICQEKSITRAIKLTPALQNLSKNTKLKYRGQVKEKYSLQKGGEGVGRKILADFLAGSSQNYSYCISKPIKSESGCSRLSPYITYGCISIKYIIHQTYKKLQELEKIGTLRAQNHQKSIDFFLSRIHWQSHFIQKLETEPELQFQNLNRDFDTIRNQPDMDLIDCVFKSQSGIPYIDATMKQLQTIGRANFRSRAIMVSFLCNTCMQPWQTIGPKLAQLFTDYEPGIHYMQMQMQAGTTGINTIRIYNPIYNGEQKDMEGRFIYKYLPELKNVPLKYIHTPWKWEGFGSIKYPNPIVDVKQNNKIAKDLLWTLKGNILKSEKEKIIEKHASRLLAKSRKKASSQKVNISQQGCLF